VRFEGFSKSKINDTEYRLNPQERVILFVFTTGLKDGVLYNVPEGKKFYCTKIVYQTYAFTIPTVDSAPLLIYDGIVRTGNSLISFHNTSAFASEETRDFQQPFIFNTAVYTYITQTTQSSTINMYGWIE
jgi:hypothetical protein